MIKLFYSQGYDEVNTDALFNKWYENKKWFIEANGGELIFEYPEIIKFEFDEEKMRRTNYWICFKF